MDLKALEHGDDTLGYSVGTSPADCVRDWLNGQGVKAIIVDDDTVHVPGGIGQLIDDMTIDVCTESTHQHIATVTLIYE